MLSINSTLDLVFWTRTCKSLTLSLVSCMYVHMSACKRCCSNFCYTREICFFNDFNSRFIVCWNGDVFLCYRQISNKARFQRAARLHRCPSTDLQPKEIRHREDCFEPNISKCFIHINHKCCGFVQVM